MAGILQVPSSGFSSIYSAVSWVAAVGSQWDPTWVVWLESDLWVEPALPVPLPAPWVFLPTGVFIVVMGQGPSGRTRVFVDEDGLWGRPLLPLLHDTTVPPVGTAPPKVVLRDLDLRFTPLADPTEPEPVLGILLGDGCHLELASTTARVGRDNALPRPDPRGIFIATAADLGPNATLEEAFFGCSGVDVILGDSSIGRFQTGLHLAGRFVLSVQETVLHDQSKDGLWLKEGSSVDIVRSTFLRNDRGLVQLRSPALIPGSTSDSPLRQQVFDCDFIDCRVGVELRLQADNPTEPTRAVQYFYDSNQFQGAATRLPAESDTPPPDPSPVVGAIGMTVEWSPRQGGGGSFLAITNSVFHFLDTGIYISPGTQPNQAGRIWIDHCTFVDNQLRCVLIDGGPHEWEPLSNVPPPADLPYPPRLLFSNNVLEGNSAIRQTPAPYHVFGGVEFWMHDSGWLNYFPGLPDVPVGNPPSILIARNLFRSFYWSDPPVGSLQFFTAWETRNRVYSRSYGAYETFTNLFFFQQDYWNQPWENLLGTDLADTPTADYEEKNDPGIQTFPSPALLPPVYYEPIPPNDADGSSLLALLWNNGEVLRSWGYALPESPPGAPPNIYDGSRAWVEMDYWGQPRPGWPPDGAQPYTPVPAIGAVEPAGAVDPHSAGARAGGDTRKSKGPKSRT